MLPPKPLSATKPKKFWAPNLYELDSDLTKEPDAIIGEGPTDSEFFHQRFRNLLYVEFVGPRKTLIKLRNLCLDWLQPETRTKEEIIELLVLEQYLTIIPEKLKPWVRAKKPENCEKLVTLLENYKEMYQPEDDNNSDIPSDDDMSRNGGETPPPRSEHSFSSDRDWNRRGRSRNIEPRDRWSYPRNPRSRLLQRDLSLPVMAKTSFEMEREDDRDLMDYEPPSQDVESYQNVMDLNEDRKPQNPIQDNMENYRKLLSLGLKTIPEAKKSTHRRGICEDESSHGVIMEKFIKDVSRASKSGRARESTDHPQRFPRMSDESWKDVSFTKRESVIQERGYEGNAFRGGFRFNSDLVSRRRVLERKRRYHFDTDGKGSTWDQRARKKPFECGSEMRKALSMSSLSSISSSSFSGSQPVDFGAMPYVCDECGRSFSVISEFVEHQIMHTRENLYEYGESFIHSVAVSEVQKSQAGGKRFECKECGETFNKSATLAEHRKIHAREYLAESNDQEYEEAFMPSPTFSELQKIYGKDKFYECKVCKETFLHSSALIEHQKTHGRGNFSDDKDNERERQREHERGEAFMPSSAFIEFQKMYGKEKIYECKVCGETFLHSSSLREHQKIHTRGNPFENKGKICEETFIPGQSFKRRQKTYAKEKLYDFKDGRDAFLSSDLSEHQKIHSRKNLFESRGYEKPVIHNMPFTESQKSHTITRPPENEEEEKAFTISSNPSGNQKFPLRENVYERKPYERSVIHSLASTAAQRSYIAVGPSKLKVIAESTIQSSNVISYQKIRSGGNSYEGKEYKRSVIHSLAAPRPLKRHILNDLGGCDERGESSIYISDLSNKRQKIAARENLYENDVNNSHEDSALQSVSYVRPQKSLAGEGPSELKQDGEFSVPSSSVRQHQKARAKKKYIEHRSNETSVIHSLPFGELQRIHPREKLYECQECGESFARISDLTEHQKIHDREKPSGSKNYERSVIRSSAPTDPQTSYAQEQYAEEQARSEFKFRQCFTNSNNLSTHQKIYAQEKSHGEETPGEETRGQETPGEETHSEKTVEDAVIQGSDLDEPQKDDPDNTIYECQDCGLGFVDLTDLTDHQNVHSTNTKCLVDSREYTHSVIHTHSISEYQREYTGEQLYECPKCGESFIHSSFLFEHQRVHEQDQLYALKGCDDGFISLLPVKPRRNRAAERNPALAGSAIRCLQCGQGFIHSSALNEHMRLHREDELLEQSEMAEEAIMSGLALTEFQGSESEEKLFECTICGECFCTASELGDHHTRVHKDEPYDYGPSFTHTSFLTEPLKGAIPFYECKDCGKSFVHSTILTKHKELHPEEDDDDDDDDSAQAVEANVIVPQEVLRIQGSNVEAAEPEVEAAEPEVEAAEPEVEAAEPNGEAEGPDGEAAEPNGEAEQPDGEAGEAEQPEGDADEPDGAGIEDPEERVEEPEGDADEPDGAGVEDPEEEGEDQEIEIEEPYYNCQECTETFTSSAAFGEHLKTHASVIVFEPANAFGECSGYIERASASTSTSTSTSAGGAEQADEKYFKCDVCGQLFNDRLSLARHQNTHTG
ncbi:paternally-expressed gene 3 protein isoform X2 [Lepus europaeus]|uniref:paternally-expressed gene 3 protein isoform X2 n=1 Tax=Lepus europaeus TaxID=9983 RepID=UPI002B4A6507|nr:paternally-expressed gene 3 protein isoform X2 [Lepus europaeus]